MKLKTTIMCASLCAVTVLFGACSEDNGVNLKDPKSAKLTKISSPGQAVGATQTMTGSASDVVSTKDEGSNDADSLTDFGLQTAKILKRAQKSASDGTTKKAIGALYNVISDVAATTVSNNSVNRSITLAKMAAKAVTNPLACESGSGTVTVDSSDPQPGDTSFSGSQTISASNCKNGSEMVSGTIKIKFSVSGDTGKTSGSLEAGNGDANADASDFVQTSYAIDGSIESTQTVSVKVTFDVDNSSGEQLIDFRANGIVTSVPASGDSEKFLMDEFGMVFSFTNLDTTTMTLNGALEHTFGAEREYSGFVEFEVIASFNGSGYTQSINGKLVVEHTPTVCGDGAYEFVTTEAFVHDGTMLTAGDVTINGNTNIHVTAPDQIEVTIDSGTPVTYTTDELESTEICTL